MQVGDKGKEGWTVLEKHKAFTVMYNIVDSTHEDYEKFNNALHDMLKPKFITTDRF